VLDRRRQVVLFDQIPERAFDDPVVVQFAAV
jgi:hypothetical protein